MSTSDVPPIRSYTGGVEVHNDFFDILLPIARASSLKCLAALWRHATPDQQAHAILGDLQAATRLSRPTVIHGLRELAYYGVITPAGESTYALCSPDHWNAPAIHVAQSALIARQEQGRPHSLPGWRRLRQEVFARDGYTCRYCGAWGVPLHCDHVLPLSRAGATSLDNLVTACGPCNLKKRTRTPQEWLS